MANEYLKRTPTSTGNRKKWTWSGWIKINKEFGSSDYNTVWSVAAGVSGNNSDRFHLYHYSDGRWVTTGTSSFSSTFTGPGGSAAHSRDPGAWLHICLSVDTTRSNLVKDKYQRFWINGIEYNYDDAGNIADNADLAINGLYEHYIGSRDTSGSPRRFDGQMFDLYLVDGQALTPDVFGFYKEGKGYVSAGSTQSTDFRPGQWSPHSPRKIKTEIERHGGFGVNGFYLPMNDSSNFGADFHCAPDSIIKLKGEDLPQPRNGLPTTSDDYVSQLRSDPYAANLVLSVPGVNTQPTGSELVTNGTFDTDASGWTITDTGTIVRQSDGTAKVTRGSSAIVAYQDITTVVGTTYELSVDITDIGGSHGQVYVYSTPHSGSLDTNIGYSFYTGTYKGTFTADTTTTRIALYAHPSGYTSYDNVSVKATTIPDYSADIKGSGTNKTLTGYDAAGVRNPNGANGFNVNGYYGSALHFDGSGDYLQTPDSADFTVGTGDYTIEGWFYFNNLSATRRLCGQRASNASEFQFLLETDSNGILAYYYSIGNASKSVPGIALSTSQWTHIAVERYNTIHTLYVNGVAVGTNNSSGSLDDRAQPFSIGRQGNYTSDTFNGYIQDFRFYKGVAKYKGGFDVPKPYTPVGIESWRQVSDTCKNNFATLNSVQTSRMTTTDGNLSWTTPTNTYVYGQGTIGIPTTGKWVFEGRFSSNTTTNNYNSIGVSISNPTATPFSSSGRYGINDASSTFGQSFIQDGVRQGSITLPAGTIIQVLVDRDNNQMTFVKDGTLQTGTGSTVTIPSDGVLYSMIGEYNVSGQINFGQNPTFSGTVTAGTYTDSNGKGLFKYQPPSGFLALCEDNLPAPTITDPGKHFKTVLYTGSGSARAVTGVGFKPDLVWIKKRSTAGDHKLIDSVRGAGLILESNTTDIEGDETGNFSGFSNDGFDLTATTAGAWNESPYSYVAWCWKAGGPAVTNTDGSLTTQVSVNQDAGFSIGTFTGDVANTHTIGHGLGKVPSMIIVKERTGNSGWAVYHKARGNTKVSYLNFTDAEYTETGDTSSWNATDPTSSVFYVGRNGATNDNTLVFYAWAEIAGFSKFGSYLGNGNADGPFVYCGFKPAWVLIKKTDGSGTENWRLFDSSRCPTNQNNIHLLPSSANAESTETGMDFLSNGFKLRHADAHQNQNGTTYIFAAFAESPFQTANAK